MERREFVVGAGALAASLTAMAASAGDKKGGKSEGHHHGLDPKLAALAAAAAACSTAGADCVRHCREMLATGDTSLAKCQAVVLDMMAICDATGKVASYGSGITRKMAKICKTVCMACAKECRKHSQHAECAMCAKACDAVVLAANAVLA